MKRYTKFLIRVVLYLALTTAMSPCAGAVSSSLAATGLNGNSHPKAPGDLIVSCPADVQVPTSTGCTAEGVALGTPVICDLCDVIAVSNDAPAAFALGSTTVTWTVTDNLGSTSTCEQTVTVIDAAPPVAICLPAIIFLDVNGSASISAPAIDGGSTDNCAIASIAVSRTLFTCTDMGNISVDLLVTDQSGNASTCSATVTVVDTVAPIALCQNVTIQLDPSGNASMTAADIDNGSNDACGITSISASQTSFTCADIGTNNVTLTVTDAIGNASTCVAIVTVVDAIAPVALCQPVTIQLDPSGNASITAADIDNGSNDACGIASISASQTAFTCADIGTNNVMLTVTDASGNASTCMAVVTVVDATAPVALCQPVTIQLDPSGNASITAADLDNGSNDACGIAFISASQTAFTCADIGTNNVTLTVTDVNGNASTCVAIVTVVDAIAPVALCQPLTIQLDPSGNASITAADLDNGSNDACGIASISASRTAFTCADVGSYNVTLTVTDASGNASTCVAVVTVVDATAPVALCQPLTIQLDPSGNASITAADLDNGSNDACGIAFISASQTAFTCAEIGTNNVTLTVTDANGNASTCVAVVTVVDATAPVALCQPVTIQLDPSGNASITAADIDNGSNDACGIASISASRTAFTCADVGSNNVTLTVTDASGNASTCVALVTVVDATAPVALCQPVTIQLDPSGNASITAADIDNGSNDACGIASISASQTAFTCADIGTNNVTLTVTDASGNASTCVAIVTVLDAIAPVALCQPVTIQLDPSGNASITAADLDNGSNDACGIAFISASRTAFTCADIGTNNVTLTVTDANGNASTCMAAVTVVDAIAPVANCQPVTIYLNGSGNADVAPVNVNNGSSDNCSVVGMTLTTYQYHAVGSYTDTLILMDGAGNVDSCLAVITVKDIIAPVAVCAPATIYLNAAGHATLTGADIDGGSHDNGTIVSLVPSQVNFHCYHLGSNNVALSVTDQGGNTNICLAVVTVVDTIAPVVICQSITVQLNANGTASITPAQINNGSWDNCNVTSVILSQTTFDCSHVGSNPVILTVTDNSGNASTCSAIVTVEDHIAPTISCPANVAATTNSGCTATAVNLGTPTIADNCGGSTVSNNAPGAFPIGNTTVTWTVTDANGNTATCNQTVTVADNVPPVTVCQPYTIYLNAAGIASFTANDIDGGSMDNCGIASITAAPATFNCENLGNNNAVLTATDNSGNTSTCSTIITVVDTIAPVASCQPVTAYLGINGQADLTAAQMDNGSTDNCGVMGLNLTTTRYYAVGAYLDTLIVKDAAGNVDSCFALVTVLDIIPPVAVCHNTTIYLSAGGTASITAQQLDSGSSDNGVISSWTASRMTFDCSNLGANSVTLTVIDAGGNASTCTATVTVLDSIAPVTACQAVTVQLDASGNATLHAAQVNNSSSDNCMLTTLSLDVNTFSCADIGTGNTVTLTVTDPSGNASTCTAIVTVEDNVAPNAVCHNLTVQLDANGNGSITAAQIDGGSNDACGIASISASRTAFTCADIGANTVTLTVIDIHGNISTCNATVTVVDHVPPVVICHAVTTYLDVTGSATIQAADLNNGSTDACGGLTFSASQSTFDCSEVGINTVTLTVTDGHGNASTCAAAVTVIDTINPVAICRIDTIHLGLNGLALVTPADLNGGSTDNCNSTSFTASITSLNAVGNYPVTLFVTDASGNVDSCQTTVIVVDHIQPVALCNDLTIYLNGSGSASITSAALDGGSHDNGTIASITASQLAFDCSHIGTNADTLFVTDQGGNTSFCVATVTVLDTIAPAAICQSITVALNTTGQAVLTGAMFNNGTTDNCGSGAITYTVGIPNPTSVGTYPVILTATDSSGNASTCSATVTVIDTMAPTAICQATTTYLDASGYASISPAMIDGGSSDNGTIAGLSASQLTFSCSQIGTNSVTLFVTDQGGNTSFCIATVTVLDTIAPTAICQGVTVQLDATGTAMITPIMLNIGSTDNCGTGSLTYSTSEISFNEVGNHAVTFTATDGSGNASTCTATVTVLDNISPVAVCQPTTIYLNATGSASISPLEINGGSTDNDTIVSYTASQTVFDCSHIGSNSVMLTVTDAGGNSSTCTATVTVLDTIAPTIVCQSITVQLGSTGVAVMDAQDIDGGSTDNCGTGNLSYSASQVSFVAIGDHAVTLTVTDASGNTSTCTAIVTVIDIIVPVAICQGTTIYLNASGSASITAGMIDGGSTDNDAIASYTSSQTSFSCADLGNNSVTLTVTDIAGNTSQCAATVTVLDTIAPVAHCQNITITLPASGQVVITPAQLNSGSTDNCPTLTYAISQSLFEHVGSFPNTLTVTDGSGNTSYCISTVTVTDLINPVAICKTDTIYLNAAGTADILPADLDGGSTDNGTIVARTASQVHFNCSHIGSNGVTLIVTDEAGNNAFCTTSVTVLDTLAPTAICQNISILQGVDGITVITGAMLNGGSTDNCGTGLTYTVDQDTLVGTGDHMVILTVTDASGNSSTCVATVTVGDNSPPVAVCQPITVYVDQSGNVVITGEAIDGGSTDNDGIVSYAASPNIFNCGNLGLNTSVLTVTDASGNTALCVAQVTVLDTIVPNAVCQNITVSTGASGTATITATHINGGTTDNCVGALTYAASQTFFPSTGIYTDTLTATDPSGNMSYCVATVTVIDVTPPITICHDTLIYLNGNGHVSISASDLDGGTTDNSAVFTFTASQTTFDCSDLGNNPVTLNATDTHGNVGSCSAVVTVIDTIAPEAICRNIDVVMDFFGNATITGIDINGGSTDNCNAGQLFYTADITEFHEEGLFEVMLTVTDVSGNSSTCISEVTVAQPVKPLKIPSGFSPNGDGIADTWEVQGLREFPDNSVVIFNRWGSKLFEAKPYLNDWAGQTTVGTLPGALPAGTYFFQLDLGNGAVHTGYIQMNR